MKFQCPHCGHQVKASNENAGEMIICPSCREKIRVPPALYRLCFISCSILCAWNAYCMLTHGVDLSIRASEVLRDPAEGVTSFIAAWGGFVFFSWAAVAFCTKMNRRNLIYALAVIYGVIVILKGFPPLYLVLYVAFFGWAVGVARGVDFPKKHTNALTQVEREQE